MAPHDSSAERRDDPSRPHGDPWNAFGYLVSGVLLYGIAGWALDRWLGTSFLVAVGILVGAALGTYQTYKRFEIVEDDSAAGSKGSAPDEHDQS